MLTRDIIEFPQSRENVCNTLEQLLAMGIIPIINENDTVAIDELDHLTKFGDNDQLSAIVAQLVHADLLIMLSDIDGFYTANPLHHKTAKLYDEITEITPDLMKQATGKGSPYGTGGMSSKLKAADRILKTDATMILANGKQPKIIFDILAGKRLALTFTRRKHYDRFNAIGKASKKSAASLSLLTATEKNHLLSAMADTLERNRSRILTENKKTLLLQKCIKFNFN